MFQKAKRTGEELLEVARQHVAELRSHSYSVLAALPEVSEDVVTLHGSPVALFTYRASLPGGDVRVFVTTSKPHLGGIVHSVNCAGFTIAPNGDITEVAGEALWEYL